MPNKLILIFILSFLASQSSAIITFEKTYGGVSRDEGYSVQQTTDGGYIIVGWTESFGAGNGDIYLIKTNLLGDTMWTRTYGGTGDDGGLSVQQTKDGGFIISGATESYALSSCDAYLIKTDSSGDTIWTKTYGGDKEEFGWSVQQTKDAGYIMVGMTTSFGAGYWDIYLVRTDSVGDTIWSRTFGGVNGDNGYSVQQTNDSGYIIAGETSSYGAGGYDVYLIKINSSGDTVWTKTYGGINGDAGLSAQQTIDGGYIITGRTTSFAVDTYGDVYLIKTNSSGDTMWTRAYSGSSFWDWGYSVQQTNDNGYIIAGGASSRVWDVYLVKVDSLGDTLWTRTFGGDTLDNAVSVQQTQDNGFIIAGYTYSFGTGGSIYLIKTDENGNIAVEESDFVETDYNLSLSPNPFLSLTTIKFRTSDPRLQIPDQKITIYDITGKLVETHSMNFINSTNSMNSISIGKNLKAGIYFLKLGNAKPIKIIKTGILK